MRVKKSLGCRAGKLSLFADLADPAASSSVFLGSLSSLSRGKSFSPSGGLPESAGARMGPSSEDSRVVSEIQESCFSSREGLGDSRDVLAKIDLSKTSAELAEADLLPAEETEGYASKASGSGTSMLLNDKIGFTFQTPTSSLSLDKDRNTITEF